MLVLDGLRTMALEAMLAEMLCTVSLPVVLACLDQALAMLDARFRAPFRAELDRRLAARISAAG